MPRLEPGMARIRVKDLRLRTFIGIKEEEILNKQDVLINLTILTRPRTPWRSTTSSTR